MNVPLSAEKQDFSQIKANSVMFQFLSANYGIPPMIPRPGNHWALKFYKQLGPEGR